MTKSESIEHAMMRETLFHTYGILSLNRIGIPCMFAPTGIDARTQLSDRLEHARRQFAEHSLDYAMVSQVEAQIRIEIDQGSLYWFEKRRSRIVIDANCFRTLDNGDEERYTHVYYSGPVGWSDEPGDPDFFRTNGFLGRGEAVDREIADFAVARARDNHCERVLFCGAAERRHPWAYAVLSRLLEVESTQPTRTPTLTNP